MSFVLDASLTMAWFLNEPGPPLDHIIDRLAEDGAYVPRMWHLEVANVFQMAIIKKRTSASDRDAAFTELRKMAIMVDEAGDQLAWTTIVQVSEMYRLTTYDAAYLELAQRRRVPLATLDKDLIKAATKAGLETLP